MHLVWPRPKSAGRSWELMCALTVSRHTRFFTSLLHNVNNTPASDLNSNFLWNRPQTVWAAAHHREHIREDQLPPKVQFKFGNNSTDDIYRRWINNSDLQDKTFTVNPSILLYRSIATSMFHIKCMCKYQIAYKGNLSIEENRTVTWKIKIKQK